MTHALAVGLCAVALRVPAYEFVPRPDRLVEFGHPNGTIAVGRLDLNGEFTLAYTLTFPKSGVMYRSGPDRPVRLGVGTLTTQPVYELRSGALIPGTMVAGGPFVPTVGGTIIRFADYVYSPTAPRIWNLPGYFRPVGGPPPAAREVIVPLPPWRTR